MSDLKDFFKDFDSKIEDTCRHGNYDEISYRAYFKHLKAKIKELEE